MTVPGMLGLKSRFPDEAL